MLSVDSHMQPFQRSSWNEEGRTMLFKCCDYLMVRHHWDPQLLNINLTPPYVHETSHVMTQCSVTSGPDALCLETVSKHVARKLCNVVGGQCGEAPKSLAPNPLLRVPWMFWHAQGSTFSGSLCRDVILFAEFRSQGPWKTLIQRIWRHLRRIICPGYWWEYADLTAWPKEMTWSLDAIWDPIATCKVCARSSCWIEFTTFNQFRWIQSIDMSIPLIFIHHFKTIEVSFDKTSRDSRFRKGNRKTHWTWAFEWKQKKTCEELQWKCICSA